jgi:hypothetical protein
MIPLDDYAGFARLSVVAALDVDVKRETTRVMSVHLISVAFVKRHDI